MADAITPEELEALRASLPDPESHGPDVVRAYRRPRAGLRLSTGDVFAPVGSLEAVPFERVVVRERGRVVRRWMTADERRTHASRVELSRCVLRPERPRLEQALAVVARDARSVVEVIARATRGEPRVLGDLARAIEPREAWEAMASAGLVPDGAVDDARRRFVDEARCYRCSGSGRQDTRDTCEGCGGTGTEGGARPHPASVEGCVVFASDWSGVLRAEELSRLCSGRGDARIVWRVLGDASVAPLRDEVVRELDLSDVRRDLLATGYVDRIRYDRIELLAPALGA